MKPTLAILCLLFAGLFASGCGTLMTRFDPWHTFSGNNPYEAVAQDFDTCVDSQGAWVFGRVSAGLVSIPADFAIDTVLLPPDVIAGACYKCRKQPAHTWCSW